jgi:hypothetical protein
MYTERYDWSIKKPEPAFMPATRRMRIFPVFDSENAYQFKWSFFGKEKNTVDKKQFML